MKRSLIVTVALFVFVQEAKAQPVHDDLYDIWKFHIGNRDFKPVGEPEDPITRIISVKKHIQLLCKSNKLMKASSSFLDQSDHFAYFKIPVKDATRQLLYGLDDLWDYESVSRWAKVEKGWENYRSESGTRWAKMSKEDQQKQRDKCSYYAMIAVLLEEDAEKENLEWLKRLYSLGSKKTFESIFGEGGYKDGEPLAVVQNKSTSYMFLSFRFKPLGEDVGQAIVVVEVSNKLIQVRKVNVVFQSHERSSLKDVVEAIKVISDILK